MRDLAVKEKIIILLLAVMVIASVGYSSDSLMTDGILAWGIRQKEYLAMAGETAVLFAGFVLIFRFSPSFVIRTAAAGVLAAVFLWAHRAFAPVAVSGLYAVYLWAEGRWILGRIQGAGRKRAGVEREFLAGCLFVVCMFCFMSAVGAGRILYLWLFVLFTAVIMIIDEWRGKKRGNGENVRRRGQGIKIPADSGSRSFAKVCLWAGVAVFFCIQAGRMNIAVDFDSLWYGVRSPYILDNGQGIYENMGMIGIVYTYSKGFEVLTLPLSVLPSYSFAISFNLWLAAGVLRLFGRVIGICAEDRAKLSAVCFLSSLPGIMNMSITAKSDMATLYFQLAMFYEILLYLKGEKKALWYAFGAFFFTWTLKPTALVFSTAVMGMSIIFLLVTEGLPGKKNHRKKEGADQRESCSGGMAVLVLSILALGGIWARTFLITGLPVTSVFSSVLTRLGFEMKYPFDVQKIPNSSAGVPGSLWLKAMAKRIWGVLFNPQGPDMDHVILAWGSLAVWFLICVCAVWIFLDKRKGTDEEKKLDHYLNTVFWPFAGCCVVSLLMLTQVDGNYFMLFYVLLTVYAFRLTERLSNKKAAEIIRGLGIPVIIFSAVIMTLTNWNWAVGFTPISWRHKGYYDHQAQCHEQLAGKGNREIWDILAADSRNRVIAIGEHPEVLAFPCSVQSYLDITGTWGNVMLVKYMDNFVEFMRYGNTDYVYAQAGYISEDQRAWSLTCDLIEYGVLVPVCFEEGNMLARVDTEGTRTEESVMYLEEFLRKYVRKSK